MEMNTLTDEELVRRCQHELPYQTESFALLVSRYKEKVFSKVLGMINNREDARDLSQDIFIKMFHGLPAFRIDASFST